MKLQPSQLSKIVGSGRVRFAGAPFFLVPMIAIQTLVVIR
jgi:hypothetical protein